MSWNREEQGTPLGCTHFSGLETCPEGGHRRLTIAADHEPGDSQIRFVYTLVVSSWLHLDLRTPRP